MIELHWILESGVVQFNSLACTEFLQDLLGLSNIAQTLGSIGVQFDNFFYLVSGILSLKNENDMQYAWWLERLISQDLKQIREDATNIHRQLKNDLKGIIRNDDQFFFDPKVRDAFVNHSTRARPQDMLKILKCIQIGGCFEDQFDIKIRMVSQFALS